MDPIDIAADPAYKRARRRVKAMRDFYSHFSVYCIVNSALFLMNYFQGGRWWFYWATIGWGIGVAAHAFAVFGFDSFLGPDWEERKIRELMEKERGNPR